MQSTIRLSDFIRESIGLILEDWENFASSLMTARDMDRVELRDHARQMLLEIADDLDVPQSEQEQSAKSKGLAPEDANETWAEVHGSDRQSSGFSVVETISEFRALRASVVSHWTKACPTIAGHQLEDLTRFHEAIDQAVGESMEQYANAKEMETRLFGAILVASPDPIYVLDLRGRFIYANRATAELFGLEPDAIIGKAACEFGFSSASDFQRQIDNVATGKSTYRGRFVHRFSSAEDESFDYVLAPVLDEHENTEATVCILRDVTAQALAEEKIWHSANHDLLTGLPNRRLFLDRLEQEVRHAHRDGESLSVLFMDLDGFKEVNDSLGHEAGDRLLAAVAERLAGCVRKDDTVARLGGDEFAVILTGAGRPADAGLVARTIVESLAEPFRIAQQRVHISVSIGISAYPGDANSTAALLDAADRAMYNAKKSGANGICFHEPTLWDNCKTFLQT